jgi:predicted dehydrogenase
MMQFAPTHVFVIGGGRWARVYLDVLWGLLPTDTTISVHTARGGEAMTGWVADRNLSARVAVTALPPQSRARSVAIIANAAGDHVAAASQALECGIPVLAEKPLAPTFSEASRLVALARARGVALAPSQVFLFARYLENFASRLRAVGRVTSLKFIWVDPKSETRHGEKKRYDATLPLQADVLPHIVPVIASLASALPEAAGAARREREGLALDMDLMAGAIPCRVHLEREGEARLRLVEAQTDFGIYRLDFSQEPGTIWHDGVETDADPDWITGPRPLARMLSAFFGLAIDRVPDHRFETAAALKALALSDLAAVHP